MVGKCRRPSVPVNHMMKIRRHGEKVFRMNVGLITNDDAVPRP